MTTATRATSLGPRDFNEPAQSDTHGPTPHALENSITQQRIQQFPDTHQYSGAVLFVRCYFRRCTGGKFSLLGIVYNFFICINMVYIMN